MKCSRTVQIREEVQTQDTCVSSGDGQDVTGVAGAHNALGKHADVVGRRIQLDQSGLGPIGAEIHHHLCVVPRGFWGF